MLITILALVLSAEYCNGQRRWAGSYSDTYSPEDKMIWDNRNYPRRDTEESAEENVRYRGRWPADNWKGQDTPDIPMSRESPPRTQHNSRGDNEPRAETSLGDKRIYQTSPEERHVQPTPDDYSTRKDDRSVTTDERDSRLKGKVSKVDDSYDTRQNTRNYKGDVGEASEEMPQGRNQQRTPSPPPDHNGNRREEDRNYEGHGEYPPVKIAPDDLMRPPVLDYARPREEEKIAVHEDGNEDNRPRGNDRRKYEPNSEYDREDEVEGGRKHEIPKTEESQNPRQERNNKGERDATRGRIPQDRREEQYNLKEDYDDKRTEYRDPPGRYRPTDNERKLTAREYIIPESQPKEAVHKDGEEDDYQEKGVGKEEAYGIEVSYTGRYNRSRIVPEQAGNDRFISTYNKGHANNDDSDEERITAREYDRRREEELKRREYERRLEEEMRRRQEEARNLRVEEDRRKDPGIRDSENRREEGRGTRRKLDEDVQIAESGRRQGHSSGSEYDTKKVEAGKTETNERNFPARRGVNRMKGTHTEEKSYREDEEQIKSPTYIRRVDERRHENVKGDLNREDRVTDRREIARSNREQTRVHNSEGLQNNRTDRKAKGEAINRESDHTVKLVNYNPSSPQPGVHRRSRQRTTDSTVDGDDLHHAATTESGYHSGQDNRNREPEHSVKHSNIQGSRERGTHSIPNERRGTVPHQTAIYVRNSDDSANRELKRIFSPPSSDANDRQGRRTYPSREESISAAPSYNGRTRQKTEDLGSDVRDSRPGPISTHPTVKNEKDMREQPVRNDNSRRQRPADNWKTINNPRDVTGYHPNVSYDTIVFLDDKSDDETDVWNISGQQDKEPNRAMNVTQDGYRRGSRGSTSYTRDSHRSVSSGSTELRHRNKRAPTGYGIRETATQAEQSRIDEVDDIHPDVEILPGYEVAKPLGQTNYNDEVLDGEVEVFSETEIKVSAKDYRRYGAIILNRDTASESQSNSGALVKGS